MNLFQSNAPSGIDPFAEQRRQYLAEVRRSDYQTAAQQRADQQTAKMTLNQITNALREGRVAGLGRLGKRAEGPAPIQPGLFPALQAGTGAVGSAMGALGSFKGGDPAAGALQAAQAGSMAARGLGSLGATGIGQLGSVGSQILGPAGLVAGGLATGAGQAGQIERAREAAQGLFGKSRADAEQKLLEQGSKTTAQGSITGGLSGAVTGGGMGGPAGALTGALLGALVGGGQQFQETAKVKGTGSAAKETAKAFIHGNPRNAALGSTDKMKDFFKNPIKAGFKAVSDWF